MRRILQIPLNHQAFDDFIAWHANKTGTFSVRSAYKIQWMYTFREHTNINSVPSGSTPLAIWSIIWILNIPCKVQIFCWRVLHGIIPLKSILMNRHIGTNGACPICHQGAEDLCHLLFTCLHAKEMWRCLRMSEIIDHASVVDRSGSAILEYLLLMPDSPQILEPSLNFKQVIAVACWYLWWIRRRITHNESVPPIVRWPISVMAIASNYEKAFTKTFRPQEYKWV